MTKAEKLFHKITSELTDAKEGKMFGVFCIKTKNNKAIAIFWKDKMMFKLKGKAEQDALSLSGAKTGTHIYNTARQMKGWVWIPFEHSNKWTKFTDKAIRQGRSKTKIKNV